MSYLPEPNSTLQAALSSREVAKVVIETSIDAIITLLALLGNALVLLVIYRKPSLRTIPNHFVIALAISDVAMAVFVKPWTIATLIMGSWIFNYELCQFQGFTSVFLASFSLNILTLMAINRYYRIVQQALHRKYFNSRRTRIYILIAVVFGIMAALPYSIAGHSYEFHAGKYFCYQREVLWSTMYLMVIYLGTPTVVIVICYLKVFLTIRGHKKNVKKMFRRNSQRITVEEIKITKTLFATVVAYLLCWMPVLVVEMITLVKSKARLPREVYIMFTMCATASSAVNPIIYGIMNRSFRKEYIRLLKSCGVRINPDGELKTVCAKTVCSNNERSRTELRDVSK